MTREERATSSWSKRSSMALPATLASSRQKIAQSMDFDATGGWAAFAHQPAFVMQARAEGGDFGRGDALGGGAQCPDRLGGWTETPCRASSGVGLAWCLRTHLFPRSKSSIPSSSAPPRPKKVVMAQSVLTNRGNAHPRNYRSWCRTGAFLQITPKRHPWLHVPGELGTGKCPASLADIRAATD